MDYFNIIDIAAHRFLWHWKRININICQFWSILKYCVPFIFKYAAFVLVKYMKSIINVGHLKTCCKILHVIWQNYFGIYLIEFFWKLFTMLAIQYLCLRSSLLLVRLITVLLTDKVVECCQEKTAELCCKLVAPLPSMPLITYVPPDGHWYVMKVFWRHVRL